jgi:hypothetical protein
MVREENAIENNRVTEIIEKIDKELNLIHSSS